MSGPQQTILLVDDNPSNLEVLNGILGDCGYRLLVATDGERALKIAAEQEPALVLLDIMMPGMDGYEVCQRLRADAKTRDSAVIFLSALDQTKDKVKGFEVGAVDYVAKPFEPEEVLARVRTHLELRQLQQDLVEKNRALEHELQVARELTEQAGERVDGALVGDSPQIASLRRGIESQASSEATLLIDGAPGSGQEAVARAIHQRSARSERAFIYVDGLALQDKDASQVFGSGGEASHQKRGKWGLALGGTFCLDNVDLLSSSLQARLEEKLAEHEAERERGGDRGDLRVIILSGARISQKDATAAHLDDHLRARLCKNMLPVPDLQSRTADLPALVDSIMAKKAGGMDQPPEGISPEALALLEGYSWPGNFEELQNVIECALRNSESEQLEIDPALLEAGKRVGHYQLVEKIGEGGMGEVWLAKHRLLVQPAAVKLIRRGYLDQSRSIEAAVKRFKLEARATSSLQSPNTVRLYDFGTTDDNAFYYVMEYLKGMDTRTMVEEYGPLPAERVIYFLCQACGSLAEAHDAGMVHRDIKPGNLFISVLGHDADVLKVLDFGIVRDNLADQPQDLTGAGNVVGSPAYIAPEMAMGESNLDGRTDLYSLACSAFFMLTGRSVFLAENALAQAVHHTSKPAVAPSTVTSNPIPKALDELLLQCLAKTKDDRPRS
ncbi:MAG: protein kinase domain-containing protein, partial [Planctomycetota bacterium]